MIDNKVKKIVTDLISKEKDVAVSSLPYQTECSTNEHLKKSKELIEDVRKQVEKGVKSGKSVTTVVIVS